MISLGGCDFEGGKVYFLGEDMKIRVKDVVDI